MRRWHALPVAALVALIVGAGLIQGAQNGAEAGGTGFSVSVDCDTATAGIQNNCTFPAGQATVTVNVVATNNSGAASDLTSFNFELTANPQTFANPPVGADANRNANPNFNDALDVATSSPWACSPPTPDNDTTLPPVGADTDPANAISLLSCFTGTIVPSEATPWPNGTTLVLASVLYNTVDGSAVTLTLGNVSTGDFNGTPHGDYCAGDPCNGATIQVGAGGVDTPTPVPATNTPLPPTATRTPCTGASCPTATSLAFVTVTPTPGGETPAAGGETPAAPPPPGGSPPPTGGAPGGGTGAGGGRPIRLPDTGAGDGGGIDWMQAGMFTLIAVAVGGAAGGAYYAAYGAVTRRRDR